MDLDAWKRYVGGELEGSMLAEVVPKIGVQVT
jgi:hypothetical protein